MSKDKLYSKIKLNESNINSYNSQIENNKNLIYELEILRNKYSNLQSTLGSRQDSRKAKLNNFISINFNQKFVSKYYDGMSSMLNGAHFNNTYNGIYSAIDKIHSKILELQNEIDNLYRQINICENNISYYKKQLKQLNS